MVTSAAGDGHGRTARTVHDGNEKQGRERGRERGRGRDGVDGEALGGRRQLVGDLGVETLAAVCPAASCGAHGCGYIREEEREGEGEGEDECKGECKGKYR